MNRNLNRSLVIGALLLAGGSLAACGQAGAAAGSGAALGVQHAQVADPTVDTAGHAWARTGNTTVALTHDSGQSWQSVNLPAPAAAGHSVTVQGDLIAAVTSSGAGLAVQRSTDAGASWQSTPLSGGDLADVSTDLAVSTDGQHVAVLAQIPGGSATQGGGELYVGGAQGGLTMRSAPVGGEITWLGDQLLLTGGTLHAQLYRSSDDGATWTQQSVDGTLASRFNVSPTVSGIGAPVPAGTAGTVLVPLTVHTGAGAAVVVYSSTDGTHFAKGARVGLAGQLGAGVTAVVSAAGPTGYVVVDPSSNALHVVHGTTQSTIAPTGLTGPIDALTFSDAQHGVAEVAQPTGCASKAACTTTEVSFHTADGGRTWQPATD
jgi:hypothetical protein